MESRRYGNKLILRLDKGDEIITSITEICKKENITAAMVNGIGFTTEIKVRIYDKDEDRFVFQTLTGSMEITCLTGNIVQADNGLFTHLHIMGADKTGNIRGGHLIYSVISATGEIILDVLDGTVLRGESNDSKLGLLRFE